MVPLPGGTIPGLGISNGLFFGIRRAAGAGQILLAYLVCVEAPGRGRHFAEHFVKVKLRGFGKPRRIDARHDKSLR